MIDRHHMTIDAYLRQAGLKSQAPETQKRFIALEPMTDMAFDQVMDDVDAGAIDRPAAQATGMRIADYLNQRTASAHSALFSHSTRFSGRLAIAPATIDALLRGQAGGKPSENSAGRDPDALIAGSIRRAARKYNLPEALIENVIRAESNFQADAVSPVGARGLMQLMPATARELGVSDAFDIEQNIDGGSRYLRQMLDRFDGDVKLALAAYNAGPGTVERYGGNVPPYRETRAYVDRILSALGPAADAVA